MTATVKTLQQELAAFESQLSAIDLEALQYQASSTRQAYESHTPPRAQQYTDPVGDSLRRVAGDAENALSNASSQVRSLKSNMAPLAAMLAGPERLEAAKADAAAFERLATEAQAALMKAQATHDQLLGLVAEAGAEHVAAVEQSALALLTAAKAGKALKPTSTDHGKLVSLEAALALAATELETATEACRAAGADLADAQDELTVAHGATASLAFELKLRQFAADVVAYRAVVGDNTDPSDDLMHRVRVLERTEA